MDSTRDDLREAKHHAKDALRSTLKAVRDALDAAIERLDEDRPGATAADATPGAPPTTDADARP
jgi:hypothetical protein